ncbi:scavenger receptor cysteine-rich type 1 protein M130 isoform X1 [Conger conger]|uniref:scavenger receptor cysteine-rich type 1 protein M130 isoform X1 n=1 Tax=Conger conger TaxID=82655 RepID=UPI002A5A959F|nr:scavenger receptor cysteine-rich type 1 protein M130 isoform X1 [Conger conger]
MYPLASLRITVVCGILLAADWVKEGGAEEISEPSNSVNITIPSLPPPVVLVQPDFIPVGANYSVYCQAARHFPNMTLSLYYRELQSASPEELQLLGSLTLEGTDTVIRARLPKIAAGERVEYSCRMEVIYSQRLYRSPFSAPATATAEEAPVRLVSQFQGPVCAGKLQMFAKGSWAPVCQDRNQGPSDRDAVALVVCRQLRCGDVHQVNPTSSSPAHRGELFMGPVECSGKEANLRECSIKGLESSCYKGRVLEIVCSDFLPLPTLSVLGYGWASSVYVYEKHELEISCTLSPQGKTDAAFELEVRGQTIFTGPAMHPGQSVSWRLDPPVSPGEYKCYAVVYGFDYRTKSSASNSVIVTTGPWFPPSPGLIVGALITILIGVGILVYMCVCRKRKEESE